MSHNDQIYPWLDDVALCMVSGLTLIGHDGLPLPDSSAPVYLLFNSGNGKVHRLLNSRYIKKPDATVSWKCRR